MGMGIAGGYAAGAGSDQLEEILKRAFLEQTERRRAKQEDARIAQDSQRIAQSGELQKAQLASLDDSRKDASADREMRTIQGMLQMMPPGATVDPKLAERARAAGFGGMLPHEEADLPSTAISGTAQAGAKAPMMGQLRMTAAGRPARDTFTGTADQHAAEQTRKDTLAQRAQQDTDRDAARKSPALREFEDAKAQGFTGSFTDYQNQDANRKRPVVNVSAAGRGELTPTAEANLTMKLGKDWQTASTASREMDRQFNLMQTGLKRFREGDTNGGSQAVLVTFQKMLDPTSVVRETEYARSADGLAMLERIQGYAERLAKGGAGMTDQGLSEMVETSREFLANAKRSTDGQRARLKALADKYKIAHELVFDDAPGAGSAPAGGAPKAIRYDMDGNPIK